MFDYANISYYQFMPEQFILGAQKQLILNSIQLSLYILLFALAIKKLYQAIKNKLSFLIKFYSTITCIIVIQIIIQAYQVVSESNGKQPDLYIAILLNIYQITCEAAAILFLSDYWNDTKEIISKESTEVEISNQTHWVRMFLLSLWFIGFSCYILYGIITSKFLTSTIFYVILELGFQSTAQVLLLLAIVSHLITGFRLYKAIKKYQSWLSSLSIKKMQFLCLYWISSFVNIARGIFLIASIVVIQIYDKVQYRWLYLYIYTFSNCFPLTVYLLGFQTKSPQQDNPSLLQSRLDRQSKVSLPDRRSRAQTQLSATNSDRSYK